MTVTFSDNAAGDPLLGAPWRTPPRRRTPRAAERRFLKYKTPDNLMPELRMLETLPD
jgi:hypothetical protein